MRACRNSLSYWSNVSRPSLSHVTPARRAVRKKRVAFSTNSGRVVARNLIDLCGLLRENMVDEEELLPDTQVVRRPIAFHSDSDTG